MSTMREQVALAIVAHAYPVRFAPGDGWDDMSPGMQRSMLRAADSAIDAVFDALIAEAEDFQVREHVTVGEVMRGGVVAEWMRTKREEVS